MTDLYLIAHKVRGEAAFDIAQHLVCPMCDGHGDIPPDTTCFECDGLGYWWIIPTSGHRAYPVWDISLGEWMVPSGVHHSGMEVLISVSDMAKRFDWTNVPDHYPTTTQTKGPTLAERLGLMKVVGKITRRI